MRKALVVILSLALAHGTSAAAASGAGQPEADAVREQLQHIPVGARVKITLRDGRRLDVYLMARSAETVTLRSRRDPPRLEAVAVSEIVSVRIKREADGLSRGQRTLIIVGAVGAAVVAIWVWVVKARPFGA